MIVNFQSSETRNLKGKFFVYFCKSSLDNATLKKDIGQLRDHIQWVKNNSEATQIYPAFVGLLLPPSNSANPDTEIQVIELQEFLEISNRLRSAKNKSN